MSNLRTRVLLREYVQAILSEDGDGFGMGDMFGAGGGGPSGYGMHFGSEDEMYKIFVKPFVDVVQVTAGKSKEVSQRLQTLLHTAFETVATTVIPVLSSDYGKIFAKEEQRLSKIKSEYADVYKATWDAFKDHDVMCAAFFYDPVSFLTAEFVSNAPAAAFKVMSILSGGTIDNELLQIKKTLAPSGKKHEGVMKEDEGKDKPTRVAQALSNKELLDKLSQSQKLQQLKREGQAMVRETLKDVFKHAQGVMRAKNVADLQRLVKKPIKGLDKLQQVPEQERAQGEQQLLKGVKESMKAFYVKSLEAQVKEAVSAGTPQTSQYVQDYVGVINKIKNL